MRLDWRPAPVLLALLTAMAVLAACGTPTDDQNAPAEELVYGLTLTPSGIDPHIHASAELGIPLRSVYDTLVYYDPATDTYLPGLAANWQIDESAAVYTFQLRQDVTFHDGTPFDAEAVRINIERILNPANNSAKARSLLGPVTTVNVVDEFTVQLVLTEPFPALLDGLSQPYIGMASPAALAEHDAATYQFNQVGTGPYRFVEYLPNDRLVLERNPDYAWGPSVLNTPEEIPTERIVFRFFTDPASRGVALQNGEAHVIGELLPTDAARLQNNTDAEVEQVPIPGQPLQIMFNTQQFPTDSLAVRQALILAADRQAIAQTVFGGFRPIAYGPLSAATRHYDPAITGTYSRDVEQAVALFDSTGLVDSNGDGLRDDEFDPVVIRLVVPPWGLTPDAAVLLEQQWESTLDIEVEIDDVASFPMLTEAAAQGEYNAISLNFFGYDPIVLNDFYLSGARLNWTGYGTTDLDVLLQAAQREQDPVARAALYSQIQRAIMDLALILPIVDYVNLVGTAPGVQGLHFDAQGWFPYLADIDY